MWSQLDEVEKLNMHKIFVAKLVRYNKALVQYRKTLSEDDIKKILVAEQEQWDLLKKKRLMMDQCFYSNKKKPRRPTTSYVFFLREKYAEKKLNTVSILIRLHCVVTREGFLMILFSIYSFTLMNMPLNGANWILKKKPSIRRCTRLTRRRTKEPSSSGKPR